jgi:hypothetical protein
MNTVTIIAALLYKRLASTGKTSRVDISCIIMLVTCPSEQAFELAGAPLEEINQPNHEDLTSCKRKGRHTQSKPTKKKSNKQSNPAKSSGQPQPEQRCLTGVRAPHLHVCVAIELQHAPIAQSRLISLISLIRLLLSMDYAVSVSVSAVPSVKGKEPSISRSRTLLLFEDFDQLLDSEDEGFLASLSTLLLESKVLCFHLLKVCSVLVHIIGCAHLTSACGVTVVTNCADSSLSSIRQG